MALALRALGLDQYEPYFRERYIDGIALAAMTNPGWQVRGGGGGRSRGAT